MISPSSKRQVNFLLSKHMFCRVDGRRYGLVSRWLPSNVPGHPTIHLDGSLQPVIDAVQKAGLPYVVKRRRWSHGRNVKYQRAVFVDVDLAKQVWGVNFWEYQEAHGDRDTESLDH